MSENDTGRQDRAERPAPKSGWWWRFTALVFGAPPIAVYGAEDEIEQERAARTRG